MAMNSAVEAYKKRQETWERVFNDIKEQVSALASCNLTPDHLICDPEHFALINEMLQVYANPNIIPPRSGELSAFTPFINIKAVTKFNVFGFEIQIIQRIEDHFKGIHVYAKLKENE